VERLDHIGPAGPRLTEQDYVLSRGERERLEPPKPVDAQPNDSHSILLDGWLPQLPTGGPKPRRAQRGYAGAAIPVPYVRSQFMANPGQAAVG
jgi:hypothetical protein